MFGVPDEEYGESVMAVVRPMPGVALDAGVLRTALYRTFARSKVPRTITFAAELPREDSGKIFKRKLCAPYWEGRAAAI